MVPTSDDKAVAVEHGGVRLVKQGRCIGTDLFSGLLATHGAITVVASRFSIFLQSFASS